MSPVLFALVLTLVLGGCAKSAHQTGQDVLDKVIPADLRRQIDESVSYAQLRASPETYVGRTLMYSGLAMKAHRQKDRTEIEVMQLPTDAGLSPADRRSLSEGRFLAVKTGEFLDPAVIEKDTPLTVVGEMKGTTTRTLDESEYVYPVLEIKHLVNWNDIRQREQVYPSSYRYGGYGWGGYGYGPYSPWYYGYGSPFYQPYGLFPYSYYGPYVTPYGFGSGAPTPSPPPPANVPPGFRER